MGHSKTPKEFKDDLARYLAKLITGAKDDRLLEAKWKLRHMNTLTKPKEIQERYDVTYLDKGTLGASTFRKGNRHFFVLHTPSLHRISLMDQWGFDS
uniref:Uncharacterized protein n=1 Tax=Cannabis sativa TaxID=3483 RepID=A0A803QCM9_CANSA